MPNGDDAHDQETYSPWLVIRCDGNDRGLRPLPNGAVFWMSPDILLDPTDALGRVLAGTQVTIRTRVFNFGDAPASPVTIEFYWADPSLVIGDATAVLIGSTMIPSIPAQWMEEVECPLKWEPLVVNGGHECLIVRCLAVSDPPHPNPPSFSPWLDRRVAQRNVTVLPTQQMQMRGPLVANPFDVSAAVTVHVASRAIRFQGGGGARSVSELLHVLARAGLPALNTPSEMLERFREDSAQSRIAKALAQLVADGSGGIGGVQVEPVRASASQLRIEPAESIQLAPRSDEPQADFTVFRRAFGELNPHALHHDPSETITELRLEPLTAHRLRIAVAGAADAHTGRWLVHQVTQAIDGMVLGGYTIIVPMT